MSICLNCTAACCKLKVLVSKEEYFKYMALNMQDDFIKESTLYISENPKHEGRESYFDNILIHEFASLKKNSKGDCIHLDRKTRLCGIYENRPQACKDYTINKCEKIRQCIN